MVTPMIKKWGALFGEKKQKPPPIFERYVPLAPSHQNAVDAIPGWSTSLPPEHGVKAGALATYADPRIAWAIQCYGSLEGREVLELGPLEAGHTFMLDRAGAQVDAVEANQLAFMRCLVAKEIIGLPRSRFWLGDFVKWLENSEKTYDLIVASGVLYHQRDPLRLLDLIAQKSSAVYMWTHLVWETHMPPDDPRRVVFSPEVEEHLFHGVKVKAHRRTYLQAEANPAFCGGMQDEHRWLDHEDLFEALKAMGFHDIQTAHEEPGHLFGPAISIFARK
ncbi:class I SAM-dependent methyltransferase [Methylocystis bryophila]|nr:class I SAM-dependent methyltransferase [Methylocystis bryophila]BDV37033.1 hypothetical protein DSM21852_02860 [Methylocystis bryophila]